MQELYSLWHKYKLAKWVFGLLSSQLIIVVVVVLLIAVVGESVTHDNVGVALAIQQQQENGDETLPPVVSDGTLTLPYSSSFRITCNFTCYPNHGGTDFSAYYGAEIRAVMSGRVITVVSSYPSNGGYYGHPGGYGNRVFIDHGNGIITRYAHLTSDIQVQVNQEVEVGQVIGYQGNSGNSTGSHLHFEWIENGVKIDSETRLPLNN